MKNKDKAALLKQSEEMGTLLVSLGYTEKQFQRINKYISPIMEKFLGCFKSLHEYLIKYFLHKQIINIGSRSGGLNNLEALAKYLLELLELGLNLKHIEKIAAHNGGSVNIRAVIENFSALIGFGFTTDDIVNIAAHCGGSINIRAVVNFSITLLERGYTRGQIVKTVAHSGGSKNIDAVVNFFPILQEFGFTTDQIIKIAAQCGGSKKIDAVVELSSTLLESGYTTDQIFETVARNKGFELLYAMKNSNKLPVFSDESLADGLEAAWLAMNSSSILSFSGTPIRIRSPMPNDAEIDSPSLDDGLNNKKPRLITY